MANIPLALFVLQWYCLSNRCMPRVRYCLGGTRRFLRKGATVLCFKHHLFLFLFFVLHPMAKFQDRFLRLFDACVGIRRHLALQHAWIRFGCSRRKPLRWYSPVRRNGNETGFLVSDRLCRSVSKLQSMVVVVVAVAVVVVIVVVVVVVQFRRRRNNFLAYQMTRAILPRRCCQTPRFHFGFGIDFAAAAAAVAAAIVVTGGAADQVIVPSNLGLG
mmetsp:Transcript_16737/g.45935  ORF Transcript_16737/g.45935 Transcript_16737/m.45935 type:complete len:216 (+) Transcript_16737:2663-3310(+)